MRMVIFFWGGEGESVCIWGMVKLCGQGFKHSNLSAHLAVLDNGINYLSAFASMAAGHVILSNVTLIPMSYIKCTGYVKIVQQ